MSSPLRSEGWTVRPNFVASAPTTPVTLLSDDHGVTQLVGEPPAAWQTPWNELADVQLVRFSRGMALFASANGVRYCWRNSATTDYEALRLIVLDHGGTIARHRRRGGVYAVAIVVLLAALAGGFGSWLYRNSTGAQELVDAKAVNLTLKDLPTGWFATTSSVLSYVFPSPGRVIKPSTVPTTLPKKTSVWGRVSSTFQQCLGVSAARDRVYGAVGQEPNYQVTSRIFTAPAFGGIEVASTSQYYNTTTMVENDVAEMSRQKFGSCFVTSNVALVKAVLGVKIPTSNIGANFRPHTFLHGWVRGGVAQITLPDVSGTVHLVMVVLSKGHYEVTLGAVVAQWPKSESFLENLSSTLMSRMTSPTSRAA